MERKTAGVWIAGMLLAAAALSQPIQEEDPAPSSGAVEEELVSPAERVVRALDDPSLRALAAQVLQDNPGLAAAAANARAADQAAPQQKALPDPTAGITGFVRSPETRVGPQKLTLKVRQTLPWKGKNASLEEEASAASRAAAAEVHALELERLAEIRRIYWELAFLDKLEAITEEFLAYLEKHESISQQRYATGTGTVQGVIKLQAEITGVQSRLIDIDSRRAVLRAEANTLRGRPPAEPLPAALFPSVEEIALDLETLRRRAMANRPELRAADHRIAGREAGLRFADRASGPDFEVGMIYTFVDERQDEAGRLNPPEDNGKDIFGLRAGIRIPLWKKELSAGVEEASERHLAALESRREIEAGIDGELGDLGYRIPLVWEQLRLLEDMLLVQAREARESALSGYVAANLNVLDLLDAERVLFDARIAAARAAIDYTIAIARLESAIAAPLGVAER
jgi:outer membrane protein TolC